MVAPYQHYSVGVAYLQKSCNMDMHRSVQKHSKKKVSNRFLRLQGQ